MANNHWAYSVGEGAVSLAFGLVAGVVKMTNSLCVAGYKWSQAKKMEKKAANVVIGPSSQSASAPVTVVQTSTPLTTPNAHEKPAFQRGFGQNHAQRSAYHQPDPEMDQGTGIVDIVDYDELLHIQEQELSSQIQEQETVIDPHQPGMVENV